MCENEIFLCVWFLLVHWLNKKLWKLKWDLFHFEVDFKDQNIHSHLIFNKCNWFLVFFIFHTEYVEEATFTMTLQGKFKLVHNGFQYTRKEFRNDVTYWVCKQIYKIVILFIRYFLNIFGIKFKILIIIACKSVGLCEIAKGILPGESKIT